MSETLEIDVVVIGLNGMQTLADCLRHVAAAAPQGAVLHVVYSDSGSTDGSCEFAATVPGVAVVCDRSGRPSASRGRNAGLRAGRAPLVQFVDCDTFLDAGWLRAAAEVLRSDPSVMAVSGRLSERHPERSVYNWIADQEWNPPAGDVMSFGGNVLIRREALERAGGFDVTLSAGEEPELGRRIRARCGSIRQIDVPMGTHDIAQTRFAQYWRRCVRSGQAFAAVADAPWAGAAGLWSGEYRRIIVRGGVAPLAGIVFLAGAVALGSWVPLIGAAGSAALLCYPTLFSRKRFMREKGLSWRGAWLYSFHCSFVVLPEVWGMCTHKLKSLRKEACAIAMAAVGTGATLILSGCLGPDVRTGVYRVYDPRSDAAVANAVSNNLPLQKGMRLNSEATPVEKTEQYREYFRSFATESRKEKDHYTDADTVQNLSTNLSDVYLVGPGDVLAIQVWMRPDVSVPRVTVAPDGTIPVPRVGYLRASGVTVQALAREIQEKLRPFYEKSEVLVHVIEYQNNKAFVLGRVSNPGVVSFSGRGTLMEALAKAGGLPVLDREATLSRCSIVRGSDTIIWIDLRELLQRGNIALNARIQNNDIIFVPESKNESAYVMGEVLKPGIVTLKNEVTVLDAVMSSGGFMRTSNVQKLYVIRSDGKASRVIPVDVEKLIERGDASDNFVLRDNDVVYVSPTRLAKFNYLLEDLTPSVRFFNLTTEGAERTGVMSEMRARLWGQQGFVNGSTSSGN